MIGLLALVAAALFAGAAVYVSIAEHPARLELEAEAQLRQWKPSYKRGALMQASLALLGFILGMAAAWQSGDLAFGAGALVLVANWPYTLLIIKPVNDELLASDPATAGDEVRRKLGRWGRLHAVRTALGLAAVAIFLYALS